ncbi:MaoC family dehydratase N-terminal domain-containing protein (plasmid) [Rhodococcus pseudokoreensis]|uniref:MaoC family dehydratase N-terminal domain-containing protein n=1 Tax=Rhodococcus pseudokoreensis TaxID=2811421 RepID=A0A974ZRA6_9NOCA|nr:MaoC family dehydratase N-terminal domain-containing protein [Rhodococcus pseudokoreensis]QSE87430.1 MaoC family dehydratase N-terminal domain-containing protein [Rhodococcus pseudokoreensis]
MKLDAEGKSVFAGQEVVSAARIDNLARALGSTSAAGTARLAPFFGPTVAGETQFVEVLGLDLSRALLGGLTYEWTRPFHRDETVNITVFIDKVFDKGSSRFGVVVAEFHDSDGDLIQRQSSTFIERKAA